MADLNALQRALVDAGLVEEPKTTKKKKTKQFKCYKCQTVMTKVPDSNVMYCEECGQYFLFDKVM